MCLLQENVTKESTERTGSPFVDPVTVGMEKLAGGWLDRILDKSDTEPADLEENADDELITNYIRTCKIPVSTWSPLYLLTIISDLINNITLYSTV